MSDQDGMEARVVEVDARLRNAALRVGRAAEEISIVAASKKQPASRMLDYQEIRSKHRESVIFGENYVQDFKKKRDLIRGGYVCHLIGHLQRNKVRDAVKLFDVIQTVESADLAEAIDGEAKRLAKVQAILLQINISRDPNKSGFLPEQLEDFIMSKLSLCEHLACIGLMTITRYYENITDVRPDFRAMRLLKERIMGNSQLKSAMRGEVLHLSMGMSQDFEIAIEEGATLVRIGTAIFGERE